MAESPHKKLRPLEAHTGENTPARKPVASPDPTDVRAAKPVAPPGAPRMPSLCDGENDRRDDDDEGGEGAFALSPIGRTQLDRSGDGGAVLRGGERDGHAADASFPDASRIEIFGSRVADEDDDGDADPEGGDDEDAEETDEERLAREAEESEALARQLMAEEAVASYAASATYLRDNADQFSEEDLAALRAVMAEEDPEAEGEDEEYGEADEEYDDEGAEDGLGSPEDMSYDALLRLGESIGDVREERWALVAQDEIRKLPTFKFEPSMAEGRGEEHTLAKCQVCQYPYEDGEELRRLPCGHCFHRECVDAWLATRDACAFCRKSIVVPEE